MSTNDDILYRKKTKKILISLEVILWLLWHYDNNNNHHQIEYIKKYITACYSERKKRNLKE